MNPLLDKVNKRKQNVMGQPNLSQHQKQELLQLIDMVANQLQRNEDFDMQLLNKLEDKNINEQYVITPENRKGQTFFPNANNNQPQNQNQIQNQNQRFQHSDELKAQFQKQYDAIMNIINYRPFVQFQKRLLQEKLTKLFQNSSSTNQFNQYLKQQLNQIERIILNPQIQERKDIEQHLNFNHIRNMNVINSSELDQTQKKQFLDQLQCLLQEAQQGQLPEKTYTNLVKTRMEVIYKQIIKAQLKSLLTYTIFQALIHAWDEDIYKSYNLRRLEYCYICQFIYTYDKLIKYQVSSNAFALDTKKKITDTIELINTRGPGHKQNSNMLDEKIKQGKETYRTQIQFLQNEINFNDESIQEICVQVQGQIFKQFIDISNHEDYLKVEKEQYKYEQQCMAKFQDEQQRKKNNLAIKSDEQEAKDKFENQKLLQKQKEESLLQQKKQEEEKKKKQEEEEEENLKKKQIQKLQEDKERAEEEKKKKVQETLQQQQQQQQKQEELLHQNHQKEEQQQQKISQLKPCFDQEQLKAKIFQKCQSANINSLFSGDQQLTEYQFTTILTERFSLFMKNMLQTIIRNNCHQSKYLSSEEAFADKSKQKNKQENKLSSQVFNRRNHYQKLDQLIPLYTIDIRTQPILVEKEEIYLQKTLDSDFIATQEFLFNYDKLAEKWQKEMLLKKRSILEILNTNDTSETTNSRSYKKQKTGQEGEKDQNQIILEQFDQNIQEQQRQEQEIEDEFEDDYDQLKREYGSAVSLSSSSDLSDEEDEDKDEFFSDNDDEQEGKVQKQLKKRRNEEYQSRLKHLESRKNEKLQQKRNDKNVFIQKKEEKYQQIQKQNKEQNADKILLLERYLGLNKRNQQIETLDLLQKSSVTQEQIPQQLQQDKLYYITVEGIISYLDDNKGKNSIYLKILQQLRGKFGIEF